LPPAWAQAFQVGVLPNLGLRVLLTNYRPLRDHLSATLGMPVEIATAPDFRTFQARTLAGEYDLVVTAANLGRIAQQDAGLTLIAGFEPAILASRVTLKAAPAVSIEALRGKALAVGRLSPGPGMRFFGGELCDHSPENFGLMRTLGRWFGLSLARFGQFTTARMVP
jgi:ABC-type phosphate/phosphonate transport system substrate-binding protein